MRAHDVPNLRATPLTAPAYPPVFPRYTGREYFTISYRTDHDAASAITPEPLTVPDPVVRLELMRMADVTGYGPYVEVGQAIAVELDGEPGQYMHAMYVDDFAAAAGGREVGAYPKVLASPALRVEHGALVGTLDRGSVRVATATMGYKHAPLAPDEAARALATPSYMVKYVLGYDASVRVCELARTSAADVTVTEAWTGPARLQLFDHVLAPLADLPVREVLSASHVVADLALSPFETVHDYLKEGQ